MTLYPTQFWTCSEPTAKLTTTEQFSDALNSFDRISVEVTFQLHPNVHKPKRVPIALWIKFGK